MVKAQAYNLKDLFQAFALPRLPVKHDSTVNLYLIILAVRCDDGLNIPLCVPGYRRMCLNHAGTMETSLTS